MLVTSLLLSSHATRSEKLNLEKTNLVLNIYSTFNSFPDLEFACHLH